MSSKSVFVIFICSVLWITQKFFVLSDRVETITNGYLNKNGRIQDAIPFEENDFIPITTCGGTLSEAPGQIELEFKKGVTKNLHCTWKLHAPKTHRVYVRELEVIYTTPAFDGDVSFNESLNFDIYDGSKVDLRKRLYKFPEAVLDNSISKEQYMTIDLYFNEKTQHIEQKLVLSYGFAKESDIKNIFV